MDRQPDTLRKKRGESREVRRGGLRDGEDKHTRSENHNASQSAGSQSPRAMQKWSEEFWEESQGDVGSDWAGPRVDLEAGAIDASHVTSI